MRRRFLVLALAFVPALAFPAQQAPERSRTVLILVDDLHVDFRSTPRLRDLLERFLSSTVREGDRVAMVATGYSSISEPPTPNQSVMTAALARFTGGGLRPEEILGAGPASGPNTRQRAGIALTTALEAIRGVARTAPARCAVLLISNGYRIDDDTLRRALQAVSEAARISNAPIYTVSPRDLFPQTIQAPDSEPWLAYVRDTRESLQSLARDTMGEVALDEAGLARVLEQLGR